MLGRLLQAVSLQAFAAISMMTKYRVTSMTMRVLMSYMLPRDEIRDFWPIRLKLREGPAMISQRRRMAPLSARRACRSVSRLLYRRCRSRPDTRIIIASFGARDALLDISLASPLVVGSALAARPARRPPCRACSMYADAGRAYA